MTSFNYTVMTLLLLETQLFKLGNAFSIKNKIEEKIPPTTTENFHEEATWKFGDFNYHNEQFFGHYNNNDHGKDVHQTTPTTVHVDIKNLTEWIPNITSSKEFKNATTPIETPWTRATSEEVSSQEELRLSTDYNEETLPRCPKHFSNQHSVCYLITEPSQFPPKCPYPPYLEFQVLLRNLDLEITPQPYWVYTNRNVTFMDGKNCLVLNGTSETNLTPTPCTDLNRGVCAYDMTYQIQQPPTQSFTDYCRTRYNTSCIANDLATTKSCYCISETKEKKFPRDGFCKKLAKIEDPYENYILGRLLGERRSCWIGLGKHGDVYKWDGDEKISEYTFWDGPIELNGNKTYYGALGRNGWVVEEDGELNCAFCEINETYPQVDLKIDYNNSAGSLELEVTNPLGVFETITCFAQNSEDYVSVDPRYIKDELIVRKLQFSFTSSGYYWCKALQLPDFTPVYSNTIFIPSQIYGNEYSIVVGSPQGDLMNPEAGANFLCRMLLERSSNFVVAESKLVRILNQDEMICHFIIKPNQHSNSEEFELLKTLVLESQFKSAKLARIRVCLASLTVSGNRSLNWPETPIEVTTIPQELCLQADGSPVTRTCTGDFYHGSHWLDVNGTCAEIQLSETTQALDNLLAANFTVPKNLSGAILNLTKSENFSSIQIHLVSKVLAKLASFEVPPSIGDLTKIINNVMHFGRKDLGEAQKSLNSTDMILYILDEVLGRTISETTEISEKLVVQISKLKKSHGFNLGRAPKEFGLSPNEEFDLALVIPEELQNEITNCGGVATTPNLITTYFQDDALFQQENLTQIQPEGRILGVTIPNFTCTFRTPLQVFFNPSLNNVVYKCASWGYGLSNTMESMRGRWVIEEGEPQRFGTYQLCEFGHMTHFTLLIMGGDGEISGGHQKALDLITAVGCGLSLFGLMVIFITAIKFRSFRAANAVVINFSVAMTAQIILLFVADNVADDPVLCRFLGAVLHYIVLVQFSWMLTIAILQYKRYVIVFSNSSPYLILISCACSWGIPLLPIIINISISRDSYGENSHGLCYALGNYFIFGVLISVSLIIFINLIVFLRIMLSIAASRKITVHQKLDDTSSLQLRLAIMLYFLLGLTWGFGLVAAIGGGIVYSYLFCITATLQGFILFLYFIVLNEKTRALWTSMKTCRWKAKGNEYEVNSDSAAGTAMVRRGRNTTSSDANTNSTTSEMLRKFKNRNSSDF